MEYLTKLGANRIIMGEREIARGISEHIVARAGTAAETEVADEGAPTSVQTG